MILVIIAAWLLYKKASANGRNGWVWALVTAGVFFAAQLIVGLGTGILIAFGVAAWGWSESTFDNSFILINIVGLIVSFLAVWPLLRWLDKPPMSEDAYNAPPPPPQF